MAAAVGKVPVSASSSVSSLSSLESATGEDDDVFAAAVESGSATGHSGRSGHSVQNSGPSPQRRAAVSSMERLVRTHPIWNLPHVDRLAASHLLRNSDIGNFIVRRSTQPNSMALTVKLSSADDQEAIEHYLIEVTSVGVRLEGSPNTFAALPLLLAYYMDNGEELECKLTLPRTVMQCETRRELCSYALLGQEFWTADLIPSDGRKIISGKVRKAALLPAVVQSENSNNRSLSLSSCPSKAGCSTQTLASSKNTATKTMAGAKVALTTMTTAITTPTTTTTATTTTTTTTLAATPVFSTNSSCGGTAARVGAGCKLVPASKARSGSLSDAFGSRLLLNSNAADSCGRKPFKFRSFFEHTRQPVIGRESRSTSASRGTACRATPERRLAGLFQPDEPVCTGTPTLARKKLLTFKPANPSSSIANSTTTNNNNSSTGFRNFGSSLRTCSSNSSGFGMLRREKSDLGWTNNITHEPWRQTSAQSGQSSLSKLNGCPNFLSNCTISSGGSTTSRLRSCVEELKRCRIGGALASRRLLTRSTLPKPAVSSPATGLNISSARAANSSNSLLRLSASKKATPRANEQSSELRHVSKRNRDGQGKRLSAPGLIDAGGGMVELLRELKTRQGQLLLNGGSESVSRPTATTTRNVATNVATATATTTTTTTTTTNVIPLVTAVATVTTDAAAATTTTTVANANNGNTPPLRVVAMNESNSNLTTIKEIAASVRERHRSRSLEAILAEEEEEAGRVVDSAAPTPRRRQKEVARRRAVVEPAPKRESDYGVLRESTVSGVSGEELDDSRSVASMAGTVFSEPWDSSMWENLLTIATSMDQPEENANKTQMEPAVWRMANSSPTAPSSPAVYTKVNPCNSPASQNAALANHIRAFQNNNFPTMFAPPWDEFSRRIPLPSEGGASIARSSVSGGSADSPSSSRDSSSRRLELIARERFVDQLNSFSVSDCESDSLMAKAKTQKRRSRRIDSGIKIQNCVVQLARNSDTFIGAQVQSFIKCTMEAQETDPHVVLGNVRQFINGLKNYLVKQGEAAFHSLIEMERSNLKPNEFLNIDAILEGVLQKIILAPLKSHIYHILVKESSKNGSLETFSENMAALRAKVPEELGILEDKCDATKMDKVRSRLRSMQHHYSPLKKLEYLLSAVSVVYKGSGSVYETTNSSNATLELPAADELVRLLVYLLSRCSVVGCEIEADYIWGLLHPALLFGEASYYLTALSSAVHVLKHIDLLPKLHDNCPFAIESIETAGAFLRVAIPDEVSGAIHNHCFPALPQISAAKLCRMIAHKFGITNPEDHGIYLLVDGFETCLLPSECPEMVKEQLRAAGKPHMFAYKRHEAKIAWPKVAVSPASQ